MKTVKKAKRRANILSFDVGDELLAMVKQRFQQEGISQSEYLRECVYLDLFFSGDFEATKFLVKKVGNRYKGVLIDKLGHTDLQAQVEALMKEVAA